MMKNKVQWLAILLISIGLAGCAFMDRDYSSLKDWRRSYMPTRQG